MKAFLHNFLSSIIPLSLFVIAFDCIVTVIVICSFIAVLLTSYFLHWARKYRPLYTIYIILVYPLPLVDASATLKYQWVLVTPYTNTTKYTGVTFTGMKLSFLLIPLTLSLLNSHCHTAYEGMKKVWFFERICLLASCYMKNMSCCKAKRFLFANNIFMCSYNVVRAYDNTFSDVCGCCGILCRPVIGMALHYFLVFGPTHFPFDYPHNLYASLHTLYIPRFFYYYLHFFT